MTGGNHSEPMIAQYEWGDGPQISYQFFMFTSVAGWLTYNMSYHIRCYHIISYHIISHSFCLNRSESCPCSVEYRCPLLFCYFASSHDLFWWCLFLEDSRRVTARILPAAISSIAAPPCPHPREKKLLTTLTPPPTLPKFYPISQPVSFAAHENFESQRKTLAALFPKK